MKYTSATMRERPGKGWQGILKYKEDVVDEDGKKRSSWKAVYRTFRDEDGNLVGKAEAKRMLADWRAEMESKAENEASSCIVRRDVTVGEYATLYVDTLEASKAVERSTVAGYRSTLKRIVSDLGDVRLNELNADTAQAWVNRMNDSGLSASTVRKSLVLLRSVMSLAVDNELISRDPLRKIKLPKLSRANPNVLDDASRTKLISVLNSMDVTPVSLGVRMALFTGMRQSELCGLRWCDVDFEEDLISIRKVIGQAGRDAYEKEPKTGGSKREFSIPASLVPYLERRKADMTAEYVTALPKRDREDPSKCSLPGDYYVLGDCNGDFLKPYTLWRAWRGIVRDYGLKGTDGDLKFHDLRHTFATFAIKNGADVKSVSSILGHADARMTLNIYTSADKKAKERTIQDVDKAMQPTQAPVIDFKAVAGE